jgi:hypothetical protein
MRTGRGMDSAEYQKLIRYYGWDYCEHDKVRRFCAQCQQEAQVHLTDSPGQGGGNA